MKTQLFKAALLFSVLSLSSCIKFEIKDENEDTEAIDSVTAIDVPALDTKKNERPIGAVYNYNDSLGIPVKKNDIPNAATPQELISLINKYNSSGKVQLEYVKTLNDTVFVKIDDSAYLTQQMGTLGSHAYIAIVTYTLTELGGIKHVNFDFKEGDHAAPGTYSRKDFTQNP